MRCTHCDAPADFQWPEWYSKTSGLHLCLECAAYGAGDYVVIAARMAQALCGAAFDVGRLSAQLSAAELRIGFAGAHLLGACGCANEAQSIRAALWSLGFRQTPGTEDWGVK